MNNQIYNSKGAEIKIDAFHPREFLLKEIVAFICKRKILQIKLGYT